MYEAQTSSSTCRETQNCYVPTVVHILEGGTVVWENLDQDFIHTVTSGTPEAGPDNRFNSVLRPGEQFQHTFGAEGSYPYYCMMHPWAQGMVMVVHEKLPDRMDHTLGPNLTNKVLIPVPEKFPLLVKSTASGKNTIINTNGVVYIESKDLTVEISGFVGTKFPTNKIKIQVIRPDKSEQVYNIGPNEDGEYHLLAKLSDHWQPGNYQVSTFYGKNQIGNIVFNISDKKVDLVELYQRQRDLILGLDIQICRNLTKLRILVGIQ